MTIMKMTKLYSLALLLGSTLAFIGCAGEEDDLFDQSAAERLNAAKLAGDETPEGSYIPDDPDPLQHSGVQG